MGSPENKRKRHFNPRSPHGERREDLSTFDIYSRISIHAPRTGSDEQAKAAYDALIQFQSTLPARGATENLLHTVRDYIISIHAPRTGSDMRHTSAARLHLISIHAPRTGSDKRHLFPSCREPISIHAPRTGSDSN